MYKQFLLSLVAKIKSNTFFELFRRIALIYRLANPRSQKYIILLHIIRFIQSFLVLVNLAGGVSILVLLKTPEIVYKNKYLNVIYDYFNFQSFDHFLVTLVGLASLLFIFRHILRIIISSFSVYAQANIQRDFTAKIFNFYMSRDYEDRIADSFDAFFQKNMTAARSTVQNTITQSTKFIAIFMNFVIIVGGLFVLNFYFSMVILISLTIIYKFIFQKLRIRFVQYGRKTYQLQKKQIRTFSRGFSGITNVIMMGKENEFLKQIHDALIKTASIKMKRQLLERLPPFLIESAIYMLIFLVVVYVLLYSKDLSFSMIIIFSAAVLKLLPMMTSMYNILNKIVAATYMYNQVMVDLTMAVQLPQHRGDQKAQEVTLLTENLEIDHVSYAYKKSGTDEAAVNDLQMVIPVGQTIALFGSSGAGKTTIAKLISGLIAPDQGSILVDGKSILDNAKIARHWQRSIAYVEQKPYFFNGTVAENIAFEFDDKAIDYDKVEEVVKVTKLDTLMRELPKGTRTFIGDNAVMISGGQAQRIAIARALYRNNTLLILDESTNALDSVTAAQILQHITRKEGKTVILIAHNLETLRQVDNIFVIQGGTVVASGSYDKLQAESEVFRILSKPYMAMAGNPGFVPA